MTEIKDQNMDKMERQKEMQKKMLKFQGMYFLMFIFSLVVIYITPIRDAIGGVFQFALFPLIGFNYNFPVLTIALSGILTGIVSGIPRYFFTDWLKIGKAQNRSQAFRKAQNAAFKANDRDKINKLRKLQQESMMDQQMVQMSSTAPLIILSMFTLLIFVWLYFFLAHLTFPYVSFPWATNVDLNAVVGFFPSWIVISFISNMVVGYMITMVIKYVDFSYQLRKYEGMNPSEAMTVK
ncbi:MAG: DUF106 domain-containing protein [Cuniculiplasma sp.]